MGYVQLHLSSFQDAHTCIDLYPQLDIEVEWTPFNTYLHICNALGRRTCIPPFLLCQRGTRYMSVHHMQGCSGVKCQASGSSLVYQSVCCDMPTGLRAYSSIFYYRVDYRIMSYGPVVDFMIYWTDPKSSYHTFHIPTLPYSVHAGSRV